jgi:two-component system C4-dicarboxylate transport response regulator DctD
VNRGAEAIEALETEGPYDAVLLDPALPDMDGIGLIKEFSGLDPHLPVIVLTGQIEVDREIRAFHEGVLAFIRKPYNREHVIALLARAVEVRNLGLKIVDMERALKESEEKFQLTVEHINDGVMYVDGSGVIVWASQSTGGDPSRAPPS